MSKRTNNGSDQGTRFPSKRRIYQKKVHLINLGSRHTESNSNARAFYWPFTHLHSSLSRFIGCDFTLLEKDRQCVAVTLAVRVRRVPLCPWEGIPPWVFFSPGDMLSPDFMLEVYLINIFELVILSIMNEILYCINQVKSFTTTSNYVFLMYI